MKTRIHFKRGITLFFALFVFALTTLHAQVLIPPTCFQNIFPAGPPSGRTPHCYSYSSINFGGPSYDGYLSSIDGRVFWRMTNPGNPAVIFNQGVVAYPNCQDISVGFNYGLGGLANAIVSYYKNGVGHFYDVYTWGLGGLTLLSSTQISTLLNYTRISMDSHRTYGIVIIWQEATSLRAITGLNGVYNGPILLGGTTNMKGPDVAFSHSSALNVHFVYWLQTGVNSYRIFESVADFFTLHASASLTPTVQDIIGISSNHPPIPSIDCPDHYSVENWAYTYAVNASDIFVRSVDFNTTGIPLTTNVVNGTVGNAPMWAKELGPRIAYNQSANTFHVTWYSSFVVAPNGQCYFTEQIRESAGLGSLISSPDYELVATNSALPPGAAHNSIAFSKQNDASPFLYTVYLDNAGVHHAFHKWPVTTSFRTSDNDHQSAAHNCSPNHNIASAAQQGGIKELTVGPNPFSGHVNLYVPSSVKDEMMNIRLVDISGKLIAEHNCLAGDAPSFVEKATNGLQTGTYFLNATIETMNIHQNFKLQCVETSDR
jgi:hypothetical protein